MVNKSGSIVYNKGCHDSFKLPRSEFLLRKVKKIEKQLILWCKKHRYRQGDKYTVSITSKGKWEVSYSNDCPLQHGSGKSFVLSEEEFKFAMDMMERVE